MRAVLGEVNGDRYLDLRLHQTAEGYEPWAYVTHQLCKIAIEETRFRPVCLDTETMGALVDTGELQGVEVQSDLLVVSKTAELERFLAKRGREADLWQDADDDDWFRRRPPEVVMLRIPRDSLGRAKFLTVKSQAEEHGFEGSHATHC